MTFYADWEILGFVCFLQLKDSFSGNAGTKRFHTRLVEMSTGLNFLGAVADLNQRSQNILSKHIFTYFTNILTCIKLIKLHSLQYIYFLKLQTFLEQVTFPGIRI